MFRKTFAIALVAAGLFTAGPLGAHEVEPLIIDLAPSGARAASMIRVSNTDAAPIAVEIYAEKRVIDIDGNETRVRADEDFIFSPPQQRVAPGEVGNFRLRYIGEPLLDQSLGYAVTIAQLPLEEMNQTGVRVLINFAASVHVVPNNARAEIKVEGGSISVNAEGKPTARFQIVNAGARHQGLASGSMLIKGPGDLSVKIEGEELREALRHTLIPAKSTRNVVALLPEGWPTSGAVSIDLTVPAVAR